MYRALHPCESYGVITFLLYSYARRINPALRSGGYFETLLRSTSATLKKGSC
ncbi:hypothetical protein E2C01_061471 [Portunus trituberculatus]|uniref:Uncharacterized protein n=1 Tax=Portunus trituberculatus TaxID=210409 RepID=A0A5B7HEG4_PORTR|nr:hypothetical protein [Portunus trituberculatus]